MPTDSPPTGFRSLVERIQERPVEAEAPRRARPLRAPRAPARAETAAVPETRATAPAKPATLLSRRWL